MWKTLNERRTGSLICGKELVFSESGNAERAQTISFCWLVLFVLMQKPISYESKNMGLQEKYRSLSRQQLLDT